MAEFKDGKLTSWSALAGNPQPAQATRADVWHADRQRCAACIIEGAGCYGRNGHEDAADDAALLAKAVGKPVRVQWPCEADEHGWDLDVGPPTLMDLRCAMDADGKVIAWESNSSCRSRRAGSFRYRW